MLNQPKRSPYNRNHILHYDPIYSPEPGVEFPVMVQHGPFIKQYLDRTASVFKNAILEYGRVLVLRFDLSLPSGAPLPADADSNIVIDRFVNAFNSQLEYSRLRRNSPHHCHARHIVAREWCPSTGRLHFHVMLLLNGHAYYTLGTRDYEGSLYQRIIQAWASALSLASEVVRPYVHVTTGKGQTYQYFLERGRGPEPLRDAFHRASYLCKLQTKHFGNRDRGLMTSRH